jgi:hypothetical protein
MFRSKKSDTNVAVSTTTGAEAQVVYTFAKNAYQEVRAYLQPWKGKQLAHVRVFSPDGSPTRKGITVSISDLPELASAVDALLTATGQSRR